MIKHYDIYESELKNKPFEAEALYYCTDSLNVYLDSPGENKRIKVSSSDVILLSTEADRTSMLVPLKGKIYAVLASGRLYIYDTDWITLGSTAFEIPGPLVVESGTPLTVTDSRVKSTNSATFIPDLSVADLVSANSCTCTDGKVTVTLTADYPITGRLIII